MQLFGVSRVSHRAEDVEPQVPVRLLPGQFHSLDGVQLSLAGVQSSGHQQVHRLALQDRAQRQVVELGVDAVLDDDHLLRDEGLELLLDRPADADADIGVVHELVDAFRPQEFPMVVLPEEVPEMA